MIIEFRARNFRSFRGDALLSLVAGGDKEFSASNIIETNIKALPRLLRSAAIFGPNASGKSTIINALARLRGMVTESPLATQPGQALKHEPFRLDPDASRQATELELTFLLDGIRHQYGCAFTAQRIVEEWLLVYPTARPQAWFHRKFDPVGNLETYAFSSYLKGGKDIWQKATRPNALFLSTAAQLNSEQLLPVYQWFSEHLLILSSDKILSEEQTVNGLLDAETNAAILELLSVADMGISGVQMVRQPRAGYEAHQPRAGYEMHQPRAGYEMHQPRVGYAHAEGAADFNASAEYLRPQFKHQSGQDAVYLDLEDESQGTQRFFHLAGPIVDILRGGKVLVVDELDGSMHPLLVRRIIGMFQDPERHPKGAQLIFTTHDTSLMDAYGLLRRDQIWMTEKHQDQASRLIPLTEYSPRKGEALARGYLSGRYGGVPLLSEMKSPGQARH